MKVYVIIATLVLVSCHGVKTTEIAPLSPLEKAPDPIVPGFVLVSVDNLPHIAPDPRSWRSKSLDNPFARGFVRLRATGKTYGDWVEVETYTLYPLMSGKSYGHCHTPFLWSERYNLTLFVPRSALSLVTTRRHVLRNNGVDEGWFPAGQVLFLGDVPGEYKIPMYDSLLTVTLPSEVVGSIYAKADYFSFEELPEVVRIETTYAVTNTTIQTRGGEVSIKRGTVGGLNAPKDFEDMDEIPVIISWCSFLPGKTSGWEKADFNDMFDMSKMNMFGPKKVTLDVEKGTAVYWADGTRAGTVVADHPIGGVLKEKPGGFLCPESEVAGGYPVCFKKSDVQP